MTLEVGTWHRWRKREGSMLSTFWGSCPSTFSGRGHYWDIWVFDT